MAVLSRRLVLAAALSAAPALAVPALAAERAGALRRGIAALEKRHGGRLGVAVLDTAGSVMAAHRGGERFAMCSTFKFLAAAFALARVDRGQESLTRRIAYAPGDLVPYSPVTGPQAGGDGMTVGDLCDAAVTLSDNTAANLLLASFGGPAGLTAYLRTLGDGVTRLDRTEPTLNEARLGDPRDTTTPVAMLGLLHRTVLGTALSAPSRAQLTHWLVGNKTGDKRLRAGIPAGWRVGDKTGTGRNRVANDIGVIWPPDRAPIIVTAFYAESRASEGEREAVLAAVGRLAAAA